MVVYVVIQGIIAVIQVVIHVVIEVGIIVVIDLVIQVGKGNTCGIHKLVRPMQLHPPPRPPDPPHPHYLAPASVCTGCTQLLVHVPDPLESIGFTVPSLLGFTLLGCGIADDFLDTFLPVVMRSDGMR